MAGLLAVILFSGSAVATKIAVTALPVVDVTVLRCLVAALAAAPLALGLRLKLPRGRQWLYLLLSSFGGFGLAPLFYGYGLALTSAVHGAMILAVSPIVTGLMAFGWERKLPTRRWWIGCVVAFSGEMILVFFRTDTGEASVAGDLIALFSTVLAAAGYVFGGRLTMSGYPAKSTAYWGCVMAGICMIPFGLVSLPGLDWGAISPGSWGAIAYLAIGATVVGYSIWYWALSHGGIERMSMFQFIQPLFSLVGATLLLGESIHIEVGIAALLVFAGVWMATRAPALRVAAR